MKDTPNRRISVLKLFLEALAIFLGVTLGFLADDFRDYREDRRLERESLGQVLQDLALDSADVLPMIDQAERLIGGSRWITNHAASRSFPSDSLSIVLDVMLQSAAPSYESATSAYSGLRMTGRIDLIQDPVLRRDLVHYFEDRQPAIASLNQDWRTYFDRWLQAAAPHIDVLATDPSVAFPRFVAWDPDAIATDREFVYLTAEIGARSYSVRHHVTELLAFNGSLRARIAAYLAEP